jgi:hypothetical protein
MSDIKQTEQFIEAIRALLDAIRSGQLGDRKATRAQVDLAKKILEGINIEDGSGPGQGGHGTGKI